MSRGLGDVYKRQHVGDALAAVFGKAFHPSGQQPQAGIITFIALFEKQLQAKANAQQGAIRLPPAQQMGHQAGGPEVGHRGVKGSDPRQDQSIDALKIFGVLDLSAALTQPFKAFLHGVEIAHAVID